MKSLLTIVAVAALAAGATGAYFTSAVNIEDNQFASGTLQIAVNGQPSSIEGFTFGPAAPGYSETRQFNVNNYGPPYFGGPSNLTARRLTLSLGDISDDAGMSADLFNVLRLKVEINRGWATYEQVYDGTLHGFSPIDLFGTRYTELIPGSSEDVKITVTLPSGNYDQNVLMGQLAEWDFVVEGRTS
jgi:predicted ribosomally synthesized peptide with SipW-like signal peptide